MKGKRILITGATGFLGFRLTEYLVQLAEVDYIIACGRKLKKGASVSSDKVNYRLGSLEDTEYVASLFSEEVTHIVHCSGLSSPWGYYNDFYTANVVSINNILFQAMRTNVSRIINISSPSIYFNGQHRLNIKENEPLPKVFINNYSRTKREAEQVLEQTDIPFISLRPRAIIGRGDTTIMPRIIRAHNLGKLSIIGDGQNFADLTSVSNVIEAIKLSLDASDQALNQHFNITNGDPVLLWDTIKQTLSALDRLLPNKKMPLALAKLIATVMEWRSSILRSGEPVLTRYSVGALALNFTMDISKAKDLLGYCPTATTEESILEFVNWFKKQSHG